MPTKPKRWFGEKNESNVWQISVEHNSTYIHPTQKPLALVLRALGNSSQVGELVLDLFAGSGSTLLACIQSGRYCYTMEQEPAFCDAVVRRLIAYSETSQNALVLKRNGEVITSGEFQCA
jgi:DNA modification methylase